MAGRLLLATGLSYVFLGPTFNRFGDWSWRYLFLAAAFPAFLVFFVRRTLPESPYFLARKGRNKEAAEVLSEITGEPVGGGRLRSAARPRSSMRELLTGALRSRALPTALIWIALNVSYYGLFLWLPFVLQAEKSFHINVYLLLTLSALSQFPGYAAAIWLVEKIGRKPTLAAFLLLGGLSAYAFGVADSEAVYVTALFFVGFFNLGAWGAVYPLHGRAVPDPPALERLRPDGGRGEGGCDRRAVHLREPEGRDRQHDVVADVRRDRDGRGCDRRRRIRARDPRGEIRLAAGDGGHDPDCLVAAQRGIELALPTHVLAVDIDVDERA